MRIRNGFLGQKLSERDEKSILMNLDYSEFFCPESFWYFFEKKYKEEYGMVIYLDTVFRQYDNNRFHPALSNSLYWNEIFAFSENIE